MNKEIKIVGAILVAGLLIAGAVYFSSKKEEKMISVPFSETTTLPKADVMDEFEANYINGCVGETATYAFCSCSYDKLMADLGKDGFLKMSVEYLQTEQLPESVLTTIKDCYKLL